MSVVILHAKLILYECITTFKYTFSTISFFPYIKQKSTFIPKIRRFDRKMFSEQVSTYILLSFIGARANAAANVTKFSNPTC